MPSKGAVKLRKDMQLSLSGFKAADFETLYLGYDFTQHQRKRHTLYKHNDLPGRFATVTRASGEVSKAYAEEALALLEELDRVQSVKAETENTPQPGNENQS
jgi:hypothetical protein